MAANLGPALNSSLGVRGCNPVLVLMGDRSKMLPLNFRFLMEVIFLICDC